MMLHEAVMLEIYRQALNASELVSPRCQSRESINSGTAAPDGRCPSNDSVYSTHEQPTTPTTTATPLATTATSPAPHMDLTPSALLPQQSAAMAAYLNAANQLFLTNPLAATLVHATPNAGNRPILTPNVAALDFSVKADAAKASDDDDEEEEEEEDEEEEDGHNTMPSTADNTVMQTADLCAPLDLSCSNRKRQSTDPAATVSSPSKKIPRINDFKAWATPTINPYLAAVAAASLSPKISSDWKKSTSSEACKALERMTEMTRLGVEKSDVNYKQRNISPPPTVVTAQTNSSGGGNGGRHSAWQSHWLNKGAHSVKDVFKCVWCKQSFPTLATLTTHMKETKHCGVNVPTSTSQGTHATAMPTNTTTMSHSNNTHNNKKSDLNLLIKETMPLPRKLVRGQDVWLGKGAEQTRQILKCMWCGQSFRSLAEMTAHMQETQHYTNIISQEQIISWKSTDDKNTNGAASPNSTTSNSSNNLNTSVPVSNSSSTSSTVSAVLTCKVCDQAFATLKELSNHMVKNSHYKEPIIRQSSESPSLGLQRRGRQLREKRKKSLPVRKLLELERAGADYGKSANNALDPALKPLRDFAASTKISCEKCGEKIETALFVEHIRQCLGGLLLSTPRSINNKSSTYSPVRKHSEDNNTSPVSSSQSSDILTPPKELEKTGSLPSVLNALEQLIEKSFDTRPPRVYGGSNANSTPLGASILKRLGIDDTVDYTKPLMDAHAMRFRTSTSYNSARDRSASESSSVSERCSSSMLESATPERQLDASRQTTPRLQTPEKQMKSDIKIKTEPTTELTRESTPNKAEIIINQGQKITVKKEFNETHYTDGDLNKVEEGADATPLNSPNDSERTTTPTTNSQEKKLNASSLNALNSMFNSLNNTFAVETNNNNNTTSNNNHNNTSTNNNNNKTKKTNANPLAALQKLCETTTDPPTINTRSNNVAAVSTAGGVSAGMLSYGWDIDAMAKCAYCDTTFYTKGAYKQHLQKVHFMKDEQLSGESQHSPKSRLTSPRSVSKSPAGTRLDLSPSSNVPTINPYEESPQSKFRKYTELAKQLSSKNY